MMGNEINTAPVHKIINFTGCGCKNVPQFGYPSDTPASAFVAKAKPYKHVSGFAPVVPSVKRSDRLTTRAYTAKVK